MAKVIQIAPGDIAHDGRPRFRKGFPDSSSDVTEMKVVFKTEYQAAEQGDTLQFEGACYEVVSVHPMMDLDSESQINGVIVFHVWHRGAIPC